MTRYLGLRIVGGVYHAHKPRCCFPGYVQAIVLLRIAWDTMEQAFPITKAERLLLIAQAIADETPNFFVAIGEGAGNLRSNAFMNELQRRAQSTFGRNYSEAKLCGDNKLAVDFYFPEEETVVEVAGMLSAPNSEYEKDIFKCLLAQEKGATIHKLMFIAKPGAAKVQNQPGRVAIARFVFNRFDLQITVEELVDPALA